MLAIVIPYYKLSFFEETLRSLVKQKDKRFNIYVGNDNSPENPETLLKIYSSKLNITYKKFENNLGGESLVKQWERCIELTKDEEWIMLLGDDDYLSDNVVSSFYDHYEKFNRKSNVVRFASQMIYESTSTKSRVYTHPVLEEAIDSHIRKFSGKSRSSLSEHIFNIKSYKKKGFINYPLAWYSDDKAWIDFSENKPIYTINSSLVYIRISKESISGDTNNISVKQESAMMFYRDVIDQCLKDLNVKKSLSLLYRFEVVIKNKRKLKNNEWKYLSNHYLKHFNLVAYLKFLRRKIILSK